MYVYVIDLDPQILRNRRFRAANSGYVDGQPCAYVGSTSKTPKERFNNHKAGIRSARFVRKFGRYLRARHCRDLGSVTRNEAEKAERKKAKKLRDKGWGVWQN